MNLKNKVILCNEDKEICKIGDTIKVHLFSEEVIQGNYDGLIYGKLYIKRGYKLWEFNEDDIEKIELIEAVA